MARGRRDSVTPARVARPRVRSVCIEPMTSGSRLQLTIAGVCFDVQSEALIDTALPNPAYAEFLSHASFPGEIDVSVLLEPSTACGLDRLVCTFVAENMWALYCDGDIHYLTHTGLGIASPLWCARYSPDMKHIVVYCGDTFVRKEAGGTVIESPFCYPVDQLLLAPLLAPLGGVLMHTAGVECGGKLWLLAGRSGAGKSTSAELLREFSGVELLSDDRIVVRRQHDVLSGHGTPWPGESRVATNRQVPVGGILFLEHSQENRITPLPRKRVLERLLPVVTIPWHEPDRVQLVLDFCGEIVESIPAYRLEFRPDEEAAGMLMRFMDAGSL